MYHINKTRKLHTEALQRIWALNLNILALDENIKNDCCTFQVNLQDIAIKMAYKGEVDSEKKVHIFLQMLLGLIF